MVGDFASQNIKAVRLSRETNTGILEDGGDEEDEVENEWQVVIVSRICSGV